MLIHEFRFLHVNILIKVGLGRATFFLPELGYGRLFLARVRLGLGRATKNLAWIGPLKTHSLWAKFRVGLWPGPALDFRENERVFKC